MTRRIILLLLTLLPLAAIAQRQLGKAVVQCPDTVYVGDKFKYRLAVPADDSLHAVVQWPDMASRLLEVIDTVSGRGTTFSMTDGHLYLVDSLHFTLRMRCLDEGTVRIPTFRIADSVSGDYYTVPERTVCCRDSSERAADGRFLCIVTPQFSKPTVALGDSVLVSFRVVTDLPADAQFTKRIEKPRGCEIGHADDADTLYIHTLHIGDKQLYSFVLPGYWLIPQHTGTVRVPPCYFFIEFYTEKRGMDIFDKFTESSQHEKHQVQAISNASSIFVSGR